MKGQIKMPNYKWFKMWNRPLTFPVKCGDTVVIPEGAKRVDIAFGQSHLKRYDEEKNKWVKMNVYRWKGKIYHA